MKQKTILLPAAMRRYCIPTLLVALLWATGSGAAFAQNIGAGNIIISTGGTYTITGSSTGNTITVASGVTANITINNVNISLNGCPFDIASGATVYLTLVGNNTLRTSAADKASLHVPSGAELIITESSTGSLNAINVGGSFMNMGAGAAIGGDNDDENSGDITINGGTVTATIFSDLSKGAAIGGSRYGNSGAITINGGTVTAITTGGPSISGSQGAAIGGGSGGIGGYDGYGTVTINGGTVTATSSQGAAIGGGSAHGGSVTITGGTVTATSGSGAAIGGGDFNLFGAVNSDITITGGTVTATSGSGAAIGGGDGRENTGAVAITGGSVLMNNHDGPQPTNGNSEDVWLNTLTVGAPAVQNEKITAGSISGIACNNTAHAASGVYGIKDVKTDGGGKVYFYLPASSGNETVALKTSATGSAQFEGNYTRTAAHGNAATLSTDYAASLSQAGTHTFPSVSYGYGSAPASLGVTVTNRGDYATGDLTVALSGAGAAGFTVSPSPVTSIPVGGTGNFSVAPNTGLNAGTYTATVTVSNADIGGLSFDVSFTVGKAAPTTAHLAYTLPASVTYDGTAKSVNVTAANGVDGLGSITVKYDAGTTEPVNAGTYNVTVEIAEGANYTAVSDLSLGNFTISKKTLSIAGGTVEEKPYDGNAAATVTGLTFDGLVSPDDNNFIIGTDYEVTAAFDNANAGTGKTVDIAATLNNTTKANNYVLPSENYSLTGTINKKPISITAATVTPKTYDGTTAATVTGLTFDGLAGAENLAPGDYEVTAAFADANAGNNKAVTVTVELNATVNNYTLPNGYNSTGTIDKKAVAIEDLQYDLAAVIYDGTAKSVDVDAAIGMDGLGNITVKYDAGTTEPVNAGAYAVTVEIADGTNFHATSADLSLGTFTVDKAVPTPAHLAYTLPASALYDGQPHGVPVSPRSPYTGMGFITVKYNGVATAALINAGAYAVTVEIAGGTNFHATVADLSLGTFTIGMLLTKDHLEYDLAAVTYTGEPQGIDMPALKSPLTDGDITVKYNGSTTVPVNAGTYAVTVDVAHVVNYADTLGMLLGDFVIRKAVPTADYLEYTLSDFIYDGESHGITVEPKEGVVGLGAITALYDGSESPPEAEGKYAVTVDIAESDNYEAVTLELGHIVIYRMPRPNLIRKVTVEPSAYYDISPSPGVHSVESGRDMILTLTPLASLPSGYVPQVTTDRRLVPDSEQSIEILPDADGTYTVRIRSVLEAAVVTVTAVAFQSAEQAVPAQVWSYGRQLYIASSVSGRAYIYNVSGRVVKIVPTVAGETVAQALSPGIYFVSTGGKSFKVVIIE